MIEQKEDILLIKNPKIVKLADGEEYTLSPLNLNTIAAIEEEFNSSFQEVSNQFWGEETKRFPVLRKLLYIFLRGNHPNLTIDRVGELVEPAQFEEVNKAIISIWIGK